MVRKQLKVKEADLVETGYLQNPRVAPRLHWVFSDESYKCWDSISIKLYNISETYFDRFW